MEDLEAERATPVLPDWKPYRGNRRYLSSRDRDVQIAMAYANLSQDWSAAQLAAIYGVSRQVVYHTLWEYAPRVAAARGRPGAHGRRA